MKIANLNTQRTDWHAPDPRDDEKELVLLYDKSLFPAARFAWHWSHSKTRPISGKVFNDNRLLIAFSVLHADAKTDDGLFLRRVFYLLPKDLEKIRGSWPKSGLELSESEKLLESIFDKHASKYPKRLKDALIRHKVE